MSNKSLTIGLVIAIVIAVIGLFTPVSSVIQKAFGGVTNYDEVDATAIKVGGSSGSRVGPIIAATSSLSLAQGNASFTVAATSSGAFDVAVTGVVSTDIVFVSLATSTPGMGWTIGSASASTTSGSIRVIVDNFTGASNTIPASVASSTVSILVFHPVASVPGL